MLKSSKTQIKFLIRKTQILKRWHGSVHNTSGRRMEHLEIQKMDTGSPDESSYFVATNIRNEHYKQTAHCHITEQFMILRYELSYNSDKEPKSKSLDHDLIFLNKQIAKRYES